MLIHPTVERLRSLGLAAMAETLVEMQNNPQAAEMPHADWLGLLIDREATFRDNRRLARRLTAAKTPSNRHHREHRLPHRSGARPGSLPDAHHKPMGPRTQPFGHCWSNRHRKILAGLRSREQSLP